MTKSVLCSALMLFCGIVSHAQFLTISDVSTQGVDGVAIELGDPNLPGLHPGIGLFAPQAPADSIGMILFAPIQGQPPMRLSNLTSGGGGIDIEIVSLNLMSHSPGISLRLDDTLDNIFGGTQIFRLNDSLPRLRFSNIGPDGSRGIEIEILPLDLVSAGPSIRLIQDPILPVPRRLELIPNDSLPFFILESRSSISSTLTLGPPPFSVPFGPSLTFGFGSGITDSTPLFIFGPQPGRADLRLYNIEDGGLDGITFDLGDKNSPGANPSIRLLEPPGLIDTTGRIQLIPQAGRDHLTISNIGSSGCDGVSIDLGDPNAPTFFGPSMDLLRPICPLLKLFRSSN